MIKKMKKAGVLFCSLPLFLAVISCGRCVDRFDFEILKGTECSVNTKCTYFNYIPNDLPDNVTRVVLQDVHDVKYIKKGTFDGKNWDKVKYLKISRTPQSITKNSSYSKTKISFQSEVTDKNRKTTMMPVRSDNKIKQTYKHGQPMKNYIQSIEPYAMENLESLEELQIESSSFEGLDYGSFAGLDRLKVLSFKTCEHLMLENIIKAINGSETVSDLKTLSLTYVNVDPRDGVELVKATLPLFTVILMRLCFKEKQTFPVYLSLIPIIGGVCIATLTEISFDIIGLGSALFATLGFSLQTIFSKKTLKDTGLHHMNLLLILSRYSTICFMPFWLVLDVTRIVQDRAVLDHDNKLFAVGLILLDGVFNMLQNVFAFTVLAMVNPLSYAVANATKRVVIIGASLVLLRNPVTMMNVVGMLVAVFGVLLYNWAKFYQKIASDRERNLPYIHSDSDLTNFVHKHNTLVHSVTEMNLSQNGFVHDNFLLENVNNNYDHVTLIPVQHNDYTDRNSNADVSKELHSRGHHVFDV